MDQETLFTASKWDILRMLSVGKKSPIQLAKISKTSVANISQQLRLLEMAGLVRSERISNRDKGQPRLLYSIVGDHSFLIASASDFVDKKLFRLSEYNKIILKIWFIDNPSVHYFLEKAFWNIEPDLERIKAIFVNMKTLDSGNLELFVVGSDPMLKDLKAMDIRKQNLSRTVVFTAKNEQALKNLDWNTVYPIYDPLSMAKKRAEGETID